MASSHEHCVNLSVLQGVRNDLERAFQEHKNSLEEKVRKTQKQWKDLIRKVKVLEKDLISGRNEVGNLRSVLISERKKREEEEKRNRKLTETIDELKLKCVRLDEKIIELEERPVVAPPPDNVILDILNELVSDTTSNFERWNERQVKLEKEVEAMKKPTTPAPTPLNPPPPANETMTPVFDNCIYQVTPEEEEQPNPFPLRAPSSPMLSRDSPPPPPEEDQVLPVPEGNNQSPPPGRNSATATDLSSDAALVDNSLSRSLSRRDRARRWNYEHGMNPQNPSGNSCLCGTSFSSKVSLNDHIQFCTMRFPGYTYVRKNFRAAHDAMAISGEEKTFGCRQCEAVLKTRLQCNTHLRLVHGKGQPSGTASRKRVKVQSSLTSRAGAAQEPSSSGSRTPRIKGGRKCSPDTHHGVDHARPLYCLCGRKFAGRFSLARHFKYYTMKTFLCRFCDKRFAYNCYLKAHVAKSHKFVAQVKQEQLEVDNHE